MYMGLMQGLLVEFGFQLIVSFDYYGFAYFQTSLDLDVTVESRPDFDGFANKGIGFPGKNDFLLEVIQDRFDGKGKGFFPPFQVDTDIGKHPWFEFEVFIKNVGPDGNGPGFGVDGVADIGNPAGKDLSRVSGNSDLYLLMDFNFGQVFFVDFGIDAEAGGVQQDHDFVGRFDHGSQDCINPDNLAVDRGIDGHIGGDIFGIRQFPDLGIGKTHHHEFFFGGLQVGGGVRPIMEPGFYKRLKRAITRIAPTIRTVTVDLG